MRKLNASYIFWKVVICFLVLLMTLIFSAPICFLLRQNDYSPRTASTVTACVSFFLYLLIQYFLSQRADFSRISPRAYLFGECLAYALLTLLSAGVCALVSRSFSPPDFSYGTFVFLPCLGLSYLLDHLIPGALLQILLYALFCPFVYLLKKKKDPTLRGAHAKAAEPSAPEPSEPAESEERDDD